MLEQNRAPELLRLAGAAHQDRQRAALEQTVSAALGAAAGAPVRSPEDEAFKAQEKRAQGSPWLGVSAPLPGYRPENRPEGYPGFAPVWKDPASAERNPYMQPWVDRSPTHAAKLGTAAVAGLPHTLKAKIEVLAKDRFPNPSKDERLARYRVINDDEIIYLRDDGYWQAELPNLIQYQLADLTGPAVSMIGNFLGQALINRLPLAPATKMIAGTHFGAAAAGLGDAAISWYFDEPINPSDVGKSALRSQIGNHWWEVARRWRRGPY